MTWWTEPDPHRDELTRDRERARPWSDEDAVTVSFDEPATTVRLDAEHGSSPDAPTTRLDQPTRRTERQTERLEQPTARLDEPTRQLETSTSTRIMPTSLIPDASPRGDDSPTVAVERLAPSRHAAPARIPRAAPLDVGAGPWSPHEARAARSHRARTSLGALGWLRLLLGHAVLAVGLLLLAAGFGTAADDLASAWNLATGAGLAITTLAWIVLPGGIGGTIAAILLTGVAWVTTLVGLWVLGTPQLQQTIGAEATSIIVNWVVPGVVLTLAAAAWITKRGKHPASIVVLLLPIVVAVAAGLVVPDGWLLGAWPSELLAPVVDAVAPVLAGWAEPWPEIAERMPAGVDGWLRVAIAVAPAMLLAWPLRGRRG